MKYEVIAKLKSLVFESPNFNATTRNALIYLPLLLFGVSTLIAMNSISQANYTFALMNCCIGLLLLVVIKLARENQTELAGNVFALSNVFSAIAIAMHLNSAPYGMYIIAPALALFLVMTTSFVTGALTIISIGIALTTGVTIGVAEYDPSATPGQMLRALWIALACTFVAATIYRRGWEKNLFNLNQANEQLKEKDRSLQKIQSITKSISFSYHANTDTLMLLDGEGNNLTVKHLSYHSALDNKAVDAILDQQIWTHLFRMLTSGDLSTFGTKDETVKIGDSWYHFLAESVSEDASNDQELIGAYSDISHIKGLESKLEHYAKYDETTGLMNRWYFMDQAKELLSLPVLNKKLFYLFLDLDGLKRINDTSGHAAGDKLITIVGELVQDMLPEGSITSRLGGDEFAAIYPAEDEHIAYQLADYLRESISNAGYFWGTGTEIGASIGLVELLENTSIEEAYSLSDIACMQAKRSGKNKVVLTHSDASNPEMRTSRNKMINQIQLGLAGNGFSLYRQEVVSLKKGCGVKKYEILLRLKDEQGNLVPTAEFLSIAEGFGYIKRIDRWVVNEIIKHIENTGAEEEYWVNLSGHSVSDESFCNYLLDLVRQSDIRPGQLNFEITETVAIESSDIAADMIVRMQKLGAKIALDDFGVGHASFANLRSLPIDVVKIDGSYVRNILNNEVDRVFTSTIIQNTHALGKQIVAEFVESQEIADELLKMGADFVQGFHFGQPEPFMDDENVSQRGSPLG